MPKDKTTRTCPVCGKDHRPDGQPLTEREQAEHHEDK